MRSLGRRLRFLRDHPLRECNFGALNGAPRGARDDLRQYIPRPYQAARATSTSVEQAWAFIADVAAGIPPPSRAP